jgi:hypothetical protein
MVLQENHKQYKITSRGLDHLSGSASQIILLCFLILKDLEKSQTPLTFDFTEATSFLGVTSELCFDFIEYLQKNGVIEPYSPPPIEISIFSKPGLYAETIDKEFDQ